MYVCVTAVSRLDAPRRNAPRRREHSLPTGTVVRETSST